MDQTVDDRTAGLDPEDLDPSELTDEELEAAWNGIPWIPNVEEIDEDFFEAYAPPPPVQELHSLLPTQFAEFAFKMPSEEGTGYESFSFEGRRHMQRIYNTPRKRLFLCCGRQVEKSTLLGNILLTLSCLVPGHRSLYVSPSATQTKTFSNDRVKDPIETSPVLKGFTSRALSLNIFEKQFVNRSKITLRYAFLNADRTRGIPAWALALDELQDFISDNIPVIEQCTSHAPEKFRRFIYSGTPKGLDNPMEYYWSATDSLGRPMSTQTEWCVPCDSCGSKAGAGRYWNILGEKNIQPKGLSCEACGKLINPQHPDATWAPQHKDGIFEGYRIPQLMVPWRKWDEILLDYTRYTRDRFYNEVLGLSFDSGIRPLTTTEIKSHCVPEVSMNPTVIEALRKSVLGQQVYMGVDWGADGSSFTVVSLGMYVGTKFRVFWIHRFTGEDEDPDLQVEKIIKIAHAWQVRVIGVDYGAGFVQNNTLIKKFGPQRVVKFQYAARLNAKIARNSKTGRYAVHRSEVMSDIISAIKRGHFQFPRWEEFQVPYAQDMLNIYTEYNNTLRMIVYQHRPDRPDDSFHSMAFCFLGSMLVRPRPDIITPKKELPGQGPQWGGLGGTVYQG